MKKSFLSLLAAGGAVLLVAGCSTHDKGPYLPEGVKTPAYEGREPVVLLDPGVQYSVTCSGVQEQMLPDGRLEVQANCVFKDLNGFSTGDETPFVMVILTENGTEDVEFDSMNTLAKKYTIRVRQAR